MKGKTAAQWSELNQIEKPLCEKKLAGLLNRLPRAQPSLPQRGSTLEYLIGQQRQQSMPHRAPKSSANLKNIYAKDTCSALVSGLSQLSSSRTARALSITARQWSWSRCIRHPRYLWRRVVSRRQSGSLCAVETLLPPDHDRTCNSNG
jgi:hypothetical protein